MTTSTAEKRAFLRTHNDLRGAVIDYSAIYSAINDMRPEVKRAKIEAHIRIERGRFEMMTEAKAVGVAMAMLSEMYTLADLRQHLEPAFRAAMEG